MRVHHSILCKNVNKRSADGIYIFDANYSFYRLKQRRPFD